ncbi:MAG: alpha/beta fold hydrolase [Ruminococcus sp.]|nr:alpha/beta fold hydrolase [Ruminococcus sp.]
MWSKTKKLMSVILTVVMIISIAAPCLTASAVSAVRDVPVVYVGGRGMSLYTAEGEKIYPLAQSTEDMIKEKAGPVLLELAAALISDEWDSYCDSLVDSVASIYADLIPNTDGEVVDGSHAGNSNRPNGKTDNYGLEEFSFVYDWRLDPVYTAKELNDYIDSILAATGKDKVRLVGRCYGSNILTAYLHEYGNEKIEQIVLYVPTALGTKMAGSLFAGKITLNPDSVESFLYQTVDYEGDPMMGMLTALVTMLNEVDVLGLGTGVIEKIYQKIKDNVLPRLVLSTYGSMPSYWAMVNDDFYDDAKEVIFGGREEEYAGMIAKIDYYHENIMNNTADIYKQADESGTRVSIISKYNKRFPPIFEGSDVQADDSVETAHASFGATCSDYTTVLSDEYIALAEENGNSIFISPDKKIDASTCMFPDRTWFVRDIAHSNFPGSISELIVKIFNEKLTVFDTEEYPQFMIWNGQDDVLSPVTGEVKSDSLWGRNIVEKFMYFITKALKFLLNIFSKVTAQQI